MIKLTTISGIGLALDVGEAFRVVAGNTKAVLCPDSYRPNVWHLSTAAAADCEDDTAAWPTATTEELQTHTTVELLVEFVKKRCAETAA